MRGREAAIGIRTIGFDDHTEGGKGRERIGGGRSEQLPSFKDKSAGCGVEGSFPERRACTTSARSAAGQSVGMFTVDTSMVCRGTPGSPMMAAPTASTAAAATASHGQTRGLCFPLGGTALG